MCKNGLNDKKRVSITKNMRQKIYLKDQFGHVFRPYKNFVVDANRLFIYDYNLKITCSSPGQSMTPMGST